MQIWFRWLVFFGLASSVLQITSSPLSSCRAEDMGGTGLNSTASPSPPPMRLRLKNNSVAIGQLLPSERSGQHLSWLNEGFSEPFHFELGAIRSATRSQAVRYPVTASSDQFRVETVNGEVIVGAIHQLDDKELVLHSSLLGQISIPRQSAISLMRIGDCGEIVYRGLTDSRVWTVVSDPKDWQFRAGTLQAMRQGASIVGDVRLPSQCEITLSLTWKGVPDFVMHFGTVVSQKKSGSIPSAARLEIWNRNVVLVRETPQDADLVRLFELNENHPQIELSILLDQGRGRILVRDLHGKQLGTIHLPFENFAVRPAIQISNHGPALSVERLEVRKWDGISLIASEQDDQILLNEGSSITGRIKRFLPDQTSFLVTDENDNENQLPLTNLAYARLKTSQVEATPVTEAVIDADTATATATQPTFEVILADGARLKCLWTQGNRLAIGLTSIGLERNFEVQPQFVVGIVGNNLPYSFSLTQNQNGVLSIGQSEIAGFLTTDPHSQTVPLRWQPHGSISASPWSSVSEGVISFSQRSFPDHWPSPKMGEPTGRIASESNEQKRVLDRDKASSLIDSSPSAAPPLLTRHLHFVSGDTIDAHVERIDEAGVHFHSDQTQVKFVEHGRISNLWLNSLASSAKQPPAEKLQRLMIVPRINKDDPPTHLLLSISGDWLRCRLLELNQDTAMVEVQRDVLTLPRDQVAQIIWLHHCQWSTATSSDRQDDSTSSVLTPDTPLDSDLVQEQKIHVTQNERGITFIPSTLQDDELIGNSELLGECRVSLRGVNRILFGPRLEQRILEAKESPWVLQLARSPRSYAATGGKTTPRQHSSIVGQPAPSFVLDCLDGQEIQSTNLLGRVVVLDFWASWCAPCLKILPDSQQVVDRFQSEQVQLIAVNILEAEARVKKSAEQLALHVPVALDRDGSTAARYSATSIPQTIVIDSQGIVRYAFSGEETHYEKELEVAIRSLLENLSK